MVGFNRKYVEVVTEQPASEMQWREIILDTGALQSTLQDIKVPKNAGGFMYKNTTCDAARNRFIYWRANHDILELSESSLDITLRQCHVRYKFAATAILSVAIFETFDTVTILAVTITSVHRFDFPHPNQLANKGKLPHLSIFSHSDPDVGGSFKNHIAVTSNSGQVPHAGSCFLSKSDNMAYFALAFPTTTVVYQMNARGETHSTEMKKAMPRIFCNLPGVLGGGRNKNDGHGGTSLVFDIVDDQTVVYILHRDCNIRMWSTRTGQCLAVLSILSENEEKLNVQKTMLRRSSSGPCVFLCYAKFSEFRLLKPSRTETSYSLNLTNIIPTPQYDIIDFQINQDRIWALWCNSEGESNISTFPLNVNSLTNWVTSNLELMGVGQETILSQNPSNDPKLAYCNYIFHSGRFQAYTIFKAAMISCRNPSFIDPYLSLTALKEKICFAIDKDVQDEIAMSNLSINYVDLSTRLWEKLYFCCEQYHMEANQPVGIFILDTIELVGIIKHNVLSFLRPCEDLENGLLTGTLPSDAAVPERENQDLGKLLDILSYIEKNLPDSVKNDFYNRLYRGETPSNAIQLLLAAIQEGTSMFQSPVNFISEVLHRIQTLKDVPMTMINLLERLRIKNDIDTRAFQRHSRYSSNVGASLVAETVRQIAQVRYTLCRNLLLLQIIVTQETILNVTATEVIRSRCVPDATIFLQSYFVISWISEPSTITGPRRQFGKAIQTTQFVHPMPLLQYFVRDRGLDLALDLVPVLYSSDGPGWKHDLVLVANTILALLWPVSGPFEFGEWLSDTFQHLLIEEYVRLLKSWCEFNSCSRHFILGLSFLSNGLSSRALDLFLQSAKGVLTEQFLTKFILHQTSSNLSSSDALAQYYQKVIKLFEKNALYDCVIAVAQVAISASTKNESHAMFQSILFNNHMYLNHYEEAYHTLINNCEPARRKDCLRQLICALIGQRRFDILLQLPLVELEEDVQNIIEMRARSMPVENDLTLSHYDFLYSFHIRRGNMRKAASTMYEEAMRCTQLPNLTRSLELRYDCLLACINALSLVDKDYSFIARPVLDDYFDTNNVKDLKEVAVVDLIDLRRELFITEAMICVEKFKKNIKSLISTGPHELMELLNSEKCYTNAIKLAKGLKQDLTPIFESLTLACIQASESPEEAPAGDWLPRNILTTVPIGHDDASTAWNFLQAALEDAVEDEPKYYKPVAKQILVHKNFLPLWLYRSYKRENLSELLHLYIQYGRLIEAFDLAIDCLSSLMLKFTSKNPEYVNIYFPVNNIDLLLHFSRKFLDVDSDLKEKSVRLNALIKEYVETSVRQI